MIKNTLLIKGNTREDGNTDHAIRHVLGKLEIETVELSEKNISYYDYEHRNADDDFLKIAEMMTRNDKIILATPVYWFSMSALMKTFIDRWSDLITIRKDIGRALAGRELFVITSYGNAFPMGYEDPFRLTCDYMDMRFGGCYYHYSGKDTYTLEQNARQADSFKILLGIEI
ncbi:MAG: NAD(P)H-dependent oxidoreductase [Chlamydiales bacterium]|nr:NAD(P)H-dependent oxidoreductase [Chlamydiales bacterium]